MTTNNTNGVEVMRALFVTDIAGNLVLLATDGEEIAYEAGNITTCNHDIGIVDERLTKEPGMYLWTGTVKYVGGCPDYAPEAEYDGTVRKVEPHEIAELYAMKPPKPPEPEEREPIAEGDYGYYRNV